MNKLYCFSEVENIPKYILVKSDLTKRTNNEDESDIMIDCKLK